MILRVGMTLPYEFEPPMALDHEGKELQATVVVTNPSVLAADFGDHPSRGTLRAIAPGWGALRLVWSRMNGQTISAEAIDCHVVDADLYVAPDTKPGEVVVKAKRKKGSGALAGEGRKVGSP